jgi:hypothetical protein
VQSRSISVDGARRALILDLFAESITIALGFGRAVQYGDDAAVIGELRCLRAAGECARELRGIEESRA